MAAAESQRHAARPKANCSAKAAAVESLTHQVEAPYTRARLNAESGADDARRVGTMIDQHTADRDSDVR